MDSSATGKNMPRFGRYEGLEEIHRGALSAVWTVRGPDGATRVARTFEPGRVALDPGQAETRVRAYLEEVRDLQEFAGASRRWARIHEVGEHEGGAYVVMDHYPMTAERLIKGRVQLSERDLDRVGDTVLRGLKELADRRGKPYGKLQPSNVFLGRVSRLSEDDVFLDPLGAIGGSGEDLSDLGDLIYQLVFFRAAHDVTTLDLGTRPGKFARYLLEARTGEGVTLEGALEYWEGLKPPDRGTRWWQVAAAAAVVLGLAVGVWWITGNGENGTNGTNGTANGGPVVEDEDWAAYQAAYDQWLGAFLDSVRGDRSVLALYGSDEQLRDRWAAELETFLKKHSKIPYPRRDDPRTSALVRIFRGIEGTLRDPAGWNLLARLETTSRDYHTRGWKSEAGFLRSLAADVQGASVEKIREVFKARDRIESLEETWNLIQERHKTLEGSENAFLARFEDHAHTWTRSDGAADGDLERLATQLTAIAELAGKLEAFVRSEWPKVVRGQLTEELRQGREDDVKPETYAVWRVGVLQYLEIAPDKARQENVEDLRDRIESELAALATYLPDGPGAA
ncbi:MAG: hypothetical protein O7J95_01515, partial [Planctomycetota bacterium]|nr:hypothetical protein [Planctomycetota bacterium]